MKYFKLDNSKIISLLNTNSMINSPFFTYQEAMSFMDKLLTKTSSDVIIKDIKFYEITKEEYDKGINLYDYLYKGDL